jgi:phosphoglycolate phosphatase-like HAD superfamily hydrolase
MAPVRAAAIDLDAVLGDTRPLYAAWAEDVGRKLGTADLERIGNWERLLERFAEDHAAAYLRPRGDVNAALRRLVGRGVRVGAFTGSPEPLARVAAAQLGAARYLEALECGPEARERLLERLGPETVVVGSPAELAQAAT